MLSISKGYNVRGCNETDVFYRSTYSNSSATSSAIERMKKKKLEDAKRYAIPKFDFTVEDKIEEPLDIDQVINSFYMGNTI